MKKMFLADDGKTYQIDENPRLNWFLDDGAEYAGSAKVPTAWFAKYGNYWFNSEELDDLAEYMQSEEADYYGIGWVDPNPWSYWTEKAEKYLKKHGEECLLFFGEEMV